MRVDLRDLRQFVTHLESLRREREAEWRELARWLLPHRGVFPGEEDMSKGTRRNPKAFNGPAVQALKRSAAGLTSGMTPANLPWFRTEFQDPAQAERYGARTYADALALRIRDALQAGGFYQAIHAFNNDFTGFGCALLFADSSPLTLARFECVQVGTFAVGLDAERRLDAVARHVLFTPGQLERKFGAHKLTEGTRRKLEKEPYAPVRVVHVVRRRKNPDPTREDALSLPWESCLYEEDGGRELLGESGYHEMPYFFAAWEEGRNMYGTGVGDDALSDVRQLDVMERRKLLGLELLLDPPMKVPASCKDRLDAAPGGRTPVLPGSGEAVEPLFTLNNFGPALQFLQADVQSVMQRLEQTLMASLYASMPMDQRPKDMSATEYLERRRESLQLMGPALAAYEPHVLTPLLERTAHILDRAGVMPLPPQSLGDDALLKIEYISPLAQAMRQTGAETTRAIVQDALSLAQADPAVLDKVDLDQAVDEMAAGIGAPGRVVRSDEEVAALRRRRAEAQAARQARADEADQAALLMQAAQTKTGPDTLAGDLMGKA